MHVQFNVRDFLDRAAVTYPDRVAIVDEPDQPAQPWGPLTFADLAVRARAQAAGLDHLGIDPGERVAIISHNSSRMLTSYFGVTGWGRILVPINFRLARAEVEYILEHSGASVLLVDPELEDELSGRGPRHTANSAPHVLSASIRIHPHPAAPQRPSSSGRAPPTTVDCARDWALAWR